VTKSELRKIYQTKRQMLLPAEREAASARIAANFFRDFDLTGICVLHCFIPIERFGEVDTRPIFQHIWSESPQIQTVVPRVNHETEALESLKYGPDVELVASRWQIHEPTHNERVEPSEIDIVLVPLLCFDTQGHRVGYGKGYYDRFLVRCRPDCLKIGISIFDPVDKIDDAHEGDVTLDFAVTPTATINFGA
jgi:5-formyltetrahydrofolate cyclo-ligase